MNKHLLVIAVAIATAAMGVAQAGPTGNAPQQQSSTTAQLSPVQRSALVAQIVRTWGPYVQKIYNTAPSVWAARMQGTFAAANDGNLRRAAEMKTFQGMVGRLTGQQLSDGQVVESLATQAQVLHSGPSTALLGSATADLVYTPLAPCRIADTRISGGPIVAAHSRNFRGYTASNFAFQGGNASSNCGIPANPSALMINVAAPVSTQSGYLTVWPYGTTMPLASNLDYKAGDLANNEIAAKMTIGSSTAEFSVFAFGTTNVVIDVVGYFMAPNATALDTTDASIITSTAAAATNTEVTNSCPTGYAITGGGCWAEDTTGNTVIIGNVVVGTTQFCNYHNYSGVGTTVDTYAHCARIPGR